MALPRFGEANLVQGFPLEESHERLEAMDYGLNGTACALLASDYEGNLVFYDAVSESNRLPDEIAEFVLAKRKGGWGFGHPAFADPSIWHRTGSRNQWGRPAMLADEFAENGVPVVPANNDPRAGLIRLRTLVEPDQGRRFPLWHPRAGEYGSPRLFIVAPRCPDLVEQLGSAPLQPIELADGGEKIDPEYEGRYAHHVAMARYAVMAKLGASEEPPPVDDPRLQLMLAEEARRDSFEPAVAYEWSPR